MIKTPIEKHRCRTNTQSLIKHGKIEKKKCWCGKPSQNHHVDYDDPHKIVFLCKKHHRAVHAPHRPKPRATTIQSPQRESLEKVFLGTDIKDLADRLKTSRSVVYNIKYGLRRVSALRAIEIEKATEGKISRKILRPDIFAA